MMTVASPEREVKEFAAQFQIFPKLKPGGLFIETCERIPPRSFVANAFEELGRRGAEHRRRVLAIMQLGRIGHFHGKMLPSSATTP